MFADHWEEQAVITLVVASLNKRGYIVWFRESADGADLEHMKATGSIVDA